MTRSIHDNFVLGYAVDAAAGSIVIHTEYRDQGAPFERTDVHFAGVIGYLFRDNLGGILFDITEEPAEHVLTSYADEFDWGSRYGWPWIEVGPNKDPREYLQAVGAKAFQVHSSIGFDGFVFAESMTITPAEQADATDRPSR